MISSAAALNCRLLCWERFSVSRKPLRHTKVRMGFLAKALLVLLVLAIAGLIHVAKLAVLYIGTDILNVGWRLLRQGIQRQSIS